MLTRARLPLHRNDAKAIWNDKGCKKGMLAIEKNWADIGNGEPFTMAAIAKIFRTQAGEAPEKLDLKEVGEFLAGGALLPPNHRSLPHPPPLLPGPGREAAGSQTSASSAAAPPLAPRRRLKVTALRLEHRQAADGARP